MTRRKGGEQSPPITAEQVHGCFEEWAQNRLRKPTIPDLQQCEPVAKVANDLAKFISERPHLQTAAAERDAVQYETEAKSEAATLRKTLQRYIETANRMKGENTRTLVDPAFKAHAALTEFLTACQGRLSDDGGAYEKARSKVRLIAQENIEKVLIQAMKKAGGRQNTSAASDQGPVLHVTARILSRLFGTVVNPATLARAKRRQACSRSRAEVR